MGILDGLNSTENNTGRTAATTSRRGAANADRPQAKVWLNVGYASPNADTDGKIRFINVPIGIAIDTMEPAKVTGQDEEFAQLRAAQNALLKHLQMAGDELEAGAEVTLNLEVRLRKVNDPLPVTSDENNPFVADFSTLFATA